MLGFAEGLAWFAQIGLFALLGLLALPGRLPEVMLPALAAGAVLTFVARPLAGRPAQARSACGGGSRRSCRLPVCAGAVPIVLATIPLADQMTGVARVFDITFVLVLVFTAVQAPTLGWFARRLRVSDRPRPAS